MLMLEFKIEVKYEAHNKWKESYWSKEDLANLKNLPETLFQRKVKKHWI